MKSFPDGEAWSGWHWVCPCGHAIHQSDTTVPLADNVGLFEAMLELVKDHRAWHRKQLRDILDHSSV